MLEAMDWKELLLEGYGRIPDGLHRCLEGLTPEQLAFRPGDEANSIAWLAWHTGRVQDDHIADLAGRPQIWIEEGWHAKFDKPADPGDTGFGYTAEQVAAFRPGSAQLLGDYYDAVHRHSVGFIQSLAPSDLDRVIDERWDPPVTAGVRLISVLADCLHHSGQMDYVRGLIEQRRWFPA